MNKFARILLLTAILFLISSFGYVFAAESKFYHVNLQYDSGTVGLKNITVLPGNISIVPQEGDYHYELFSYSNTLLYKATFSIPQSIIAEEFDFVKGTVTSKNQTMDKLDFSLNIPYFDNGKAINIYDTKNTKILEISAAEFSQFCGNNICEINENHNSCPKDCPLTNLDKIQCGKKDGICNSNCPVNTDPDCKSIAQPNDSLRTLIIIASSPISIVLLIAIVYWIIRKRRQKTNTLR